ncbi:hypothetical protein [Aromatoleum petrolei]|uniref:Uncharacterized protein n=1 Tax=Aromatoleum petrolei TaxID=76116 RepID=A0ABX1MLM7_9RHOO|nr:hypothetical protein [Aromatoleum petrolei]NMF88865.1 hypothetical protein [Aromatoleum petrolei]QTQ37723.1 Uncharacterized protein ToN1_36110 [Aromatoleum petrolei]
MIPQQQASIKDFAFIAGQVGPKVGSELANRLKRRVDPRSEDYATQVEAERRDLAAVIVLGYN